MVQSPSWEANWFAASQEIPHISRNPKVHYRTHKRPPSVCILGQPNPVHIPTSNLLEIHPNIIHTSTPWSRHWSPSLRFPHQESIHPPLLTHTRHMPSPSHQLDSLISEIYFWNKNSTCFGQFFSPWSGVFRCTHSNTYRFAASSQAVSKPLWHIPLRCVQWKTPDDGQRNFPKHVEFLFPK